MKRPFNIILITLSGAFLIILAIVIIRTFTYPFHPLPAQGSSPIVLDTSYAPVSRFSEGLQIPTVSSENYSETDFEPFDRFKEFLSQSYPMVYSTMEFTVINDYGLVFTWKGKNTTADPIIFLSHYDVVPPGPEATGGWAYPPFSGMVAGGNIYGRGSIDMKGMLLALLEAAESLIGQGHTPARNIYFAFGYDEEVGGSQGSMKIVEYFKTRQIKFESVFDEGGIILIPDSSSLVDRPVALIGVAEKGFVTYQISIKGIGGHAGMPPRHSALGNAGIIMQRFEDNQMKARLTPPIRDLLINTGLAMGIKNRIGIANQWLFRSLLLESLSGSPSGNAIIRTTTALTMARGSDAFNVLPASADIVVNFRILPGNTVADVTRHVEEICDGFDTEIKVLHQSEPSPFSSVESTGYKVLSKAVSDVFPGVIITPFISIIATDSRQYEDISENIYRLIPVGLTAQEQRSIHNYNEYLSIENYRKMIACFKEVILNYP